MGHKREGECGDVGGDFGDSGDPGAGGEPCGDPGESGILNKEERDELLPVLILILMGDFVPMRSLGGPSSTSD